MPNPDAAAEVFGDAEIRYRSVIEAIPELLYEVDARGTVLFCNRPEAAPSFV